MSEEKRPVPAKKPAKVPEAQSSSGEIDAFLRRARAVATMRAATAGGRLILALDATMSRQPTWDLACALQAEMFDAVGQAGKTNALGVQLVYFRGLGECRASKFVGDTAALKRLMTEITCRGGHTQIGKVLGHTLKETATAKVDALVYIGDAMEEQIDELADKAGNLGLRGVPVFVFQEGRDGVAETAFKEIARLSNGAWFRFDRNSAATLAKLLSAVAVFAAGGMKALEARGRPEDRLMIEKMGGGGTG
jgi:orotidine-5'-phosphate decarboxylase